VVKYYKIRILGTEEYYNNKGKWQNESKGRLFTRHAVLQIIRYWKQYEEQNLENIQLVEYDLLERQGYDLKSFLTKYQKTPIIINK